MGEPSPLDACERRWRVAIVAHTLSAVGGAENSTQAIARRLGAAGAEVAVFAPDVATVARAFDGVSSLSDTPARLFDIGLRASIANMRAKRAFCRRLADFDAVHFAMLHPVLALFPFLWLRNWVAVCRGADVQNPRKTAYRRLVAEGRYPIRYKGFRTQMSRELWLRLVMVALGRRGRFVGISEDMTAELRSLGAPAGRAVTILNGVDVGRFEAIRAAMRFTPQGRPVRRVLAVGRNDSRKGFFFLIDAAQALAARGVEDVRFVIKGRSHEKTLEHARRAGLERYFTIVDLDFNVDFELDVERADDGRLPDATTVALFHACDAVIIPSIIEALSNVGLEAEAADKPLIVSDTFGVREYIRRGTAIGARVGDGTDMADAILRALDDPAERKRLRAARAALRGEIDVSHAVEAHAALLGAPAAFRSAA